MKRVVQIILKESDNSSTESWPEMELKEMELDGWHKLPPPQCHPTNNHT